jgi:autotransporter passenger strand-loop-strand repeat protein
MAIFEVGQRREQNMTNTVLPSGGTTSSVGIVVNVGDTLTIQSGGVATGTMIDGAVPGYTPALLSALETRLRVAKEPSRLSLGVSSAAGP